MGILDIFRDAPDERIEYAMQNQALQEEVRELSNDLHEVQEDLLKISDAFDNAGWAPLGEDQAAEIPLATVKKVANIARALNAMNPFVKRGVEARIGYIWGKGISFDGIDAVRDKIDANRKKLFSPQAYEELERVLATDGNAFTAMPVDDNDTAFRISLDEIEGAVSNPLDKEDIWYYKRNYTVAITNSQTGEVTKKNIIKYYPSVSYYQKRMKDNNPLPRRWNKIGVEQNYVMLHTTVNKQVGWRWGVADIMPVIFWAKAYKEYLEDNAMLVKAYSRLAWQVKVSSANGAAGAASQVMTPPTRDPITGEVRNVGGTGLTGTGTDLSPIAAVGSSVDFTKGSPLASAIAAGLEVSQTVITSNSGAAGSNAAESTLDLPTLKAMEKRQQLHTERFLEIFEFWGVDITPNNSSAKTTDVQEAKTPGAPSDIAVVTWPQISTDATKDRIAALGTAVELGVIYKQEARKEAIEVFGIAPFKPSDDLPTMADDPAAKEKFDQGQQQAQAAADQAAVIAKQGVSGGVAARGGAMSTNNQARDSRSKNTNNS